MGFGSGGASAGLVIRGKEVQLLAVHGARVTSQVSSPIEEGEGPDRLTKAVQAVIASSGLRTRRMAVSIPSQDVLFRFFMVPLVPKPEWDSVVQFEVRKYIPFKTDLLIWDYRAMPSAASPKQLEVIFAAIPREAFRKTQELLTAAGVEPAVIEPRSLSLAHLIDAPKGKDAAEFTCIVDVEQERAHLAIVRNRLPYLTRDLSLVRGNQRLETPASADAAASASEPAPEDPAPSEELEAVDRRARRLLSELSVSMDFFIREHPLTRISRVVLCGEESMVGPWCPWLAEHLHHPVELATPIIQHYLRSVVPLQFAAAIGLLRGSREGGGSINFLKRAAAGVASRPPARDTKQELKALVKGPRAIVAAASMAALLLTWWAGGMLKVGAEQGRLDQLRASRADVGFGLNILTQEELDTLRGQAETELAMLTAVMDQRTELAEKLDALVRALPEGVWLTSLAFVNPLERATGRSQPRLELGGGCFLGEAGEELTAIQELERRVKGSLRFLRGFASAQLEEIKASATQGQDGHGYRTFQMECNSATKL